MRALLQKEWFLIKISLKSLLLIVVIFFGIDYLSNFSDVSNISFSQMVPVILAMQIHTSLGYDEQSGFANFALSLPINKKTYLKSKYLTGFLLSFGGFLLTVIFGILSSLTQQRDMLEYLLSSSLSVCMGLTLLAIALPLIYKFGVEGSRIWIMILLMALLSILAGIIGTLNFESPLLSNMTIFSIAAVIGAILLLMTYISYRVSLKFFHFK